MVQATAEVPVKTDEIDRQGVQAIESAKEINIQTSEQYLDATTFLKSLKGLRARIEDTFRPVIDAAHNAHKKAIAAMKKHSDPVDQAESIVKHKVAGYLAAEEKKRQEQEAKARAEAKKKADDEALRRAEDLQKQGKTAQAEQVLNTPTTPAPVILAKTTPDVQGVSTRKVWKFRIIDANLIPREYMTVDEKKIGGVVRALKDATNIPGVEVYAEDTVAVRSDSLL